MEQQPLVSCVIPSYKRADTLKRAIDSVLNQTYSNIEVLVVDDNIPDDEYSLKLKEILSSFPEDKVHYISQEKHINGAVARNVGLKEAKGEFVAYLDDDDEWEPTKIEKQVGLLMSHPEIGGSSCLYGIYRNGEVVSKYPPYNSDKLQFKILSRQVAMYTSTFIGRKEVLNSFGGFNESLLRHQDLQLFTDFLNYSSIEPINEHLVKIHADSAINRTTFDKYIQIKRNFFEAERDTIDSYPKRLRKRIYGAHYFELFFSALKSKKIFPAIKYFIKGCNCWDSINDLYLRFKRR